MTIEELNEWLKGEGRRETYSSLFEVLDDRPLDLDELLDTGSITLRMAGRTFEISLTVKEIT